tara:strand:+ start:292 stop:594 length:303 start_codon:yes stop_codon:yes gene_type:complete
LAINNGNQEDSFTILPVSPGATIDWKPEKPETAFKMLKHVSNGVQYETEQEADDMDVYMYEPRYLDFIKFKEDSEGQSHFGDSEDASNPHIKIRLFKGEN